MVADSVDVLCHKAREALVQRNPQRARQLYLQALGLRSDSPDVHYGLATVCFQLKDLASACHHFREVTRLDPLRAGAFINLGAVLNLMDQTAEAITVLRRGIQLDPRRAEGFYNMALVHRRRGELDLAVQAYREALRINPQMPDAHYNLANVYFEKEAYGQAGNHYKQALALRPGWDRALHGLAQVDAAQAQARQAAEASHAAAQGLPPPTVDVDLDRNVDPMAHAELLTNLHRATIESENLGRQFLQVLEGEIEPAIKELSSCLLYPDTAPNDLDQCVQRFETAIASIRTAQRSMQLSIDRVRSIGERLFKV